MASLISPWQSRRQPAPGLYIKTYTDMLTTPQRGVYKHSSTLPSRFNNIPFSPSLPTVIRRHPSHPGSLPLYRTTTQLSSAPFSSASVLYTLADRPLSGSPVFGSRIGINRKFALFPPILCPTPKCASFSSDAFSFSRDSRSVLILSRMP